MALKISHTTNVKRVNLNIFYMPLLCPLFMFYGFRSQSQLQRHIEMKYVRGRAANSTRVYLPSSVFSGRSARRLATTARRHEARYCEMKCALHVGFSVHEVHSQTKPKYSIKLPGQTFFAR